MPDGVMVVPADEGDAEEKALRDALTEVQESTPEAEPSQAESKSEPAKDKEQEKVQSDNSEPEAETSRERDEKGRFKAKVEIEPVKPLVEGQPEDAQKKEGTEPPPPTDKDQARLARQWQKTQAEKLEVRNALAEVRQLREQLQQQLQRAPQTQAQFDSRRLWLAAEDFDKQASALFAQGDIEQGNAKLQLARETRQYAQQEAQKEHFQAQQQQSQNFERTWQQNAEVIIQKYPTLGDPSTQDAQDMMEVLEELPILGHVPNGFALAAQWLGMKREAASASELRAERDKLEKENKELRGRTAISGGGVTPKLGQVNPEDMDLDQMEAHLRAQLDTNTFHNY